MNSCYSEHVQCCTHLDELIFAISFGKTTFIKLCLINLGERPEF